MVTFFQLAHSFFWELNHSTSTKWLVSESKWSFSLSSAMELSTVMVINVVAAFHIIFGAHLDIILFTITLKILMLIRWLYGPRLLPIISTIDLRMVTLFWACCGQSHENTWLLVSILGAAPKHKPLKYKCLIKCTSLTKAFWLRYCELIEHNNVTNVTLSLNENYECHKVDKWIWH
jgi:hypothetical protein